NAVVLSMNADCDVFAVHYDELEAAVQVFHVRGGRIRGERGWIVERLEDSTPGELAADYLRQAYGEVDPQGVAPEVLVDVMPEDPDTVGDWLRERRGGGRVTLRVPERGEKAALLETVRQNAQHSLALHRTRRASDLTTRSEALRQVHEVL